VCACGVEYAKSLILNLTPHLIHRTEPPTWNPNLNPEPLNPELTCFVYYLA